MRTGALRHGGADIRVADGEGAMFRGGGKGEALVEALIGYIALGLGAGRIDSGWHGCKFLIGGVPVRDNVEKVSLLLFCDIERIELYTNRLRLAKMSRPLALPEPLVPILATGWSQFVFTYSVGIHEQSKVPQG